MLPPHSQRRLALVLSYSWTLLLDLSCQFRWTWASHGLVSRIWMCRGVLLLYQFTSREGVHRLIDPGVLSASIVKGGVPVL